MAPKQDMYTSSIQSAFNGIENAGTTFHSEWQGHKSTISSGEGGIGGSGSGGGIDSGTIGREFHKKYDEAAENLKLLLDEVVNKCAVLAEVGRASAKVYEECDGASADGFPGGGSGQGGGGAGGSGGGGAESGGSTGGGGATPGGTGKSPGGDAATPDSPAGNGESTPGGGQQSPSDPSGGIVEPGGGGSPGDAEPTDPSEAGMETEPEKLDHDELLEKYRVEPDPDGTTTWTPDKATEWIADGVGTEPREVSVAEAKMLDALTQVEQAEFCLITADAEQAAAASFGESDERADAFKETYLNARLADRFGAEWAAEYATAHQQVPSADPVEVAKDLHNNEVGRQIIADNPGATTDEIKRFAEDAVDNGNTVVVSEGELTSSDATVAARS